MNRLFALIGALLLAFISISSACTAASAGWIHFTLAPDHGDDGKLKATFRSENRGHGDNDWSTQFRPTELSGLDLAGFRGSANRPIRFALNREAGRLDCSGNGGNSYASGYCSFTPDPAFTELLERQGIGRPTEEQGLGLMAVNARRELVEAIAAAHYPAPSIDNLMALSALDVTGAYIRELSNAGYRPRTIDSLIQFKALNITPAWIAGFVRIGYADLPGDQLVQLKALDITPDYVAGFERVGYHHLSADQLVQLKAMDISPEFVRAVAGTSGKMPDTAKLIELKIFGGRH
ncbi:MAG TPA: hypothetical protein VHE36_10940 [Sphingomicrobium sp.]|jgi:hypothetical protein|nr:hypothetical protein [Sphingomicrobium sp.]